VHGFVHGRRSQLGLVRDLRALFLYPASRAWAAPLNACFRLVYLSFTSLWISSRLSFAASFR